MIDILHMPRGYFTGTNTTITPVLVKQCWVCERATDTADYEMFSIYQGRTQHDTEHNTNDRKLELCSDYDLGKDTP